MNHPEAYCLMTYSTDDGSEKETLWNSRDGVTPFCINSAKTEKAMNHVAWNMDARKFDFVPPVGMRVFVDATRELVEPWLREFIEKNWPMNGYFKTKEEAFEALLPEWIKPGSPWIITVTPETVIKREYVSGGRFA